jgi:hypothetical protein
VDKVFTDKASGKDTQRPELDACCRSCAKATRLWCTAWIVWRNLDDLRRLVQT